MNIPSPSMGGFSALAGVAAARQALEASGRQVATAVGSGSLLAQPGGDALAGALVQQQAAVYAFKASVKALEVQGSLVGTLLHAVG